MRMVQFPGEGKPQTGLSDGVPLPRGVRTMIRNALSAEPKDAPHVIRKLQTIRGTFLELADDSRTKAATAPDEELKRAHRSVARSLDACARATSRAIDTLQTRRFRT